MGAIAGRRFFRNPGTTRHHWATAATTSIQRNPVGAIADRESSKGFMLIFSIARAECRTPSCDFPSPSATAPTAERGSRTQWQRSLVGGSFGTQEQPITVWQRLPRHQYSETPWERSLIANFRKMRTNSPSETAPTTTNQPVVVGAASDRESSILASRVSRLTSCFSPLASPVSPDLRLHRAGLAEPSGRRGFSVTGTK